ncbi:hypothetical protein M5K25_018955 [Dendrobium thyrsiflorum]|uniref:SAC domain-containing protein n=1 Tax=Dendrobium thyrsiflorum TaxID=117978 RepID=A0ABD0UDF0_DENTH
METGGGSRDVGLQQGFCCRELELEEFPDKYVIRSLDPNVPDQAFSISRSDGDIKLLTGDAKSESPTKVSQIFGVVGILRLISGTYILVISSRKEVGTYLGFPVYSAMTMKFLSCSEAWRTSQEKRDEAYFMSLLRIVESTPGLYYSYELDLTLNLQRACKLDEVRFSKPLWKQADPRYVWNKNLLEDLIEHKTTELILKDSPAKITLISRRCNRRLGTRMWRRGASLEGDTANFIETEQLLELEGFKFSFLQVRGSIPLLWEQIVDLSYKPRLQIIGHEETAKVVERHFNDLIQRYGTIIVLDLTDKGKEKSNVSLRRDPSWKYSVQVDVGGEKTYVYLKCNFCGKVVKGGVTRMKEHLSCSHKNVAPCASVPDNVKDEIAAYMKKSTTTKHLQQEQFDERIEQGAYYGSESGKGSTSTINNRGARGPMD